MIIKSTSSLNFTLIIAGVLLVGVNIYLWRAETTQMTLVEARLEQAQWLRDLVTTPRQPPAATEQAATRGALATMKQLELEAKRAKLDDLLTRMEQQGVKRVQLIFEKISFNRLLGWFDQVYRSTRLQPRQVLIVRQPDEGMVSAQAVYF